MVAPSRYVRVLRDELEIAERGRQREHGEANTRAASAALPIGQSARRCPGRYMTSAG